MSLRLRYNDCQYSALAFRLVVDRTFGEVTGRDLLRVVGEKYQGRILLALADHEVDDDERFEDDCPC